jgi:hypothetical protein
MSNNNDYLHHLLTLPERERAEVLEAMVAAGGNRAEVTAYVNSLSDDSIRFLADDLL